ncbi:MAG TPA: RNA repair transcriptional activator RtcR family protein, partial [Archangium sp.]|uniref:RNA repair transcriptional activator RtcR family protein n=1 Tax=Archangium sp. TaxID=1872627 RepID=UPI002EDADA61
MASSTRRTVVFSILGTKLDAHHQDSDVRHSHWRPTVALCNQRHQDPPLRVDELVLLYRARNEDLATLVEGDVHTVSPTTRVTRQLLEIKNTFDFDEVHRKLREFAQGYDFRHDQEDYFVHLTTGSHVIQICLFLLTYQEKIPARLVQTFHPPCQMGRCWGNQNIGDPRGSYRVVSRDLPGFASIRSALEEEEKLEGVRLLKGGIETRNAAYNNLIELIEKVSFRSKDPILLEGETGVGKTLLAKRISALKQKRYQPGDEPPGDEPPRINCATLRDPTHAHSTLFGHVKGA